MKRVNLGEHIEISTGKLDANKADTNGKYPFFTCSKEPLKINQYSYDCECVLVAGNGDLNVKYYKGKFDAYQRTYIIKAKNSTELDTKYLYYLIDSNIEQLRRNAIGGVIKYIKLKNLTDIKFQNRNIAEQRNIVVQLDKVQKIIDRRKKQIEELEDLIKCQFVEMFGNLKLNDKCWKNIDKIGNLCILNPKKSEISSYSNVRVSFIPMQSVSEKGEINVNEIRWLDDVKSNFTYFRENDILFAKITPCMENGKGAVARGLKNKIGFGSTEFHIIRPKENVNSIWLYTLTSLNSFRKEAELKMSGSAGQKRVPIKFLKDYKIGLPPIDLQNQFAKIVKQIEKQKEEIQKNLKEMQQLKKSLMNQYFG